MFRKRLLVAGATAVALALALAGCAGSSSGTSGTKGAASSGALHTVNVGIVNLSLFAPLYVAQAKGYFADEGLSLNLQAVSSGQDAIPLASSGKLDVVVAGFSAGMFNAINEGLDVKVVGSMAVASGDPATTGTKLVGSKKAGITSVSDLKGKKIGAAGGVGGTGAYYTALALKKAGLSLKDVTVVNLSNPDIATALTNGSLDAGLIAAPFSTNTISSGAGVALAVPPKGASGTGVLYGGQFAASSYAQKFFDALAKGAKDLQNGAVTKDANLKIIASATGQTVAALKTTPFDTWLPNLAPLPDQLEAMQSVWMQAGALNYTKPLASSDYIDKAFAAHVPSS